MDEITITHNGCGEVCTMKHEANGCGDEECCGSTEVWMTIDCPVHGELINKQV